MRRLILLLAAFLLAAPLEAATAPRLSIASFDQLPKPLPLPYDEQADATAAVAAARARAKAHHKLLLIDLGGNWCLDCRLLAGVIELPQLHGFLFSKYEIVTVDIGRFNKNLAIPGHYGLDGNFGGGVPNLLVVDPRTDKLLNAGHTAALEDARSMSPQALADWLGSWTK